MNIPLREIAQYIKAIYKPREMSIELIDMRDEKPEYVIFLYYDSIDDRYITNPYNNDIISHKGDNLEREIRSDVEKYFSIKTSGLSLQGFAPYSRHGLTINVFNQEKSPIQESSIKKNKKYYVDNSDIHGKGVFANKDLKKNEVIGLTHTIDYDNMDIFNLGYKMTHLGNLHNHSKTPNCNNVLIGDKSYLIANRDIKKGEELTNDYRERDDLEQPEDWKEINESFYRTKKDIIIESFDLKYFDIITYIKNLFKKNENVRELSNPETEELVQTIVNLIFKLMKDKVNPKIVKGIEIKRIERYLESKEGENGKINDIERIFVVMLPKVYDWIDTDSKEYRTEYNKMKTFYDSTLRKLLTTEFENENTVRTIKLIFPFE